MRIGAKTALFLSAAAVAAAAVTPAQAKVVARSHTVNESYEFTQTAEEACGFPMHVAGEFDDLFIAREGEPDDGAFLVHSRFAFTDVYTNLETGESMSVTFRSNLLDLQLTHIGGDIFEARFRDAGQLIIRDADGDLVSRNRGSVHGTYRFDTEGDDIVGGIVFDRMVLRVAGPHPNIDDEFCDILIAQIG